jgi:hypothetical protein
MTQRATRLSQLLGFTLAGLLGVVALAILPAPAQAQYENDTLAVAPGNVSTAGAEVHVVAGPTGAPGGFTIWWMTRSDFEANGGVWWPAGAAFQKEASFTGTPTLHTEGGTLTSFALAPNQAATIELGDLFDETGVTTNSPVELEPGVEYVFCAFANAGAGLDQSDYSATYAAVTLAARQCIFSQGFWKNHPTDWPVTSLTLGTVTYTKAQLLAILGTPAAGNGLISLAHQFIATLLNIANGGDPTVVASSVTAANAMIGSLVVPPVGSGYLAPATTSALTQIFADYNTGVTGSGKCVTATNASTWGAIKARYR